MALQLYNSNRMELLVEYLSLVLDQEKLHPLNPEIIIVQSQGMARFLALELAQRNRVWANGVFPFPNGFLEDIFGQILGEEIALQKWQRGSLAWRIFNVLPSLLGESSFAVPAAYCQSPEKSFQLSQQISDLFDQYVLYRPEMIRAWTQGQDSSWQPVLWRRLAADIAQPHRADLFARVLAALSTDFSGTLPPRISLFGISSMAPQMIDLFAALGDHTQVNLFFLNPCQEEWSQIMTRSAITKAELVTGQEKEEQYLDNGNELLASMGHLGRDFYDLILAHDPVAQEMVMPTAAQTLLGAIQNNILELESPAGNLQQDESVQLVSCHNPMREVEVLHDHLLQLFSAHADLQPRDIFVMAPDIGVYGPLIDAVFRGEKKAALPYSIADQSMQEQECFAGFLQLLKVAKGRFRVTEIMALLEIPAVCRQFGFTVEDLVLIKAWLGEVHIHWGRDRLHRAELGLPPSSEHSFRSGINRLLLGFAMDGDELFMGMLPFQGGELELDTANRFLTFYELLLELASFIAQSKSIAEWSQGLLDVVDSFFAATSEQEWEITKLRTILASLVQDAEQGQFSGEVTPEVIGVWLKKGLTLDLSPYGFLSGGITFCSLLPMRAIPCKVVCLLGMNDADFPRTQIHPNFDLTARDYRKGDRNKRYDDRYLFLEALLSARQQLYISYVGRSIVDNREILPSVLVSELQEYMLACICGAEGQNLVIQHCIQPFNADYYNGRLPRSFSRENYEACTVFMDTQKQDADFLRGLVIPEATHADVISLHDVLRFWQNPPAFFCRHTLGLVWENQETQLEDDEPFSLFGLSKYGVALQCTDLLLKGIQPGLPLVRATGVLPQGVVGDMGFSTVLAQAEQLVAQLQTKMTTPCGDVETTLACGGYSLEVHLGNLFTTGQVVPRIGGKIDGRHVVQAWILHLVLQLLDIDCEKTTFLIGADEILVLHPVADAEEFLVVLLDLYHRGLTTPLPFFAKSAWEYAKNAAAKNRFMGLTAANKKFEPGFKRFSPESAEPAVLRCFGDGYVLGTPFADLAQRVFGPLFEVMGNE
jgi:exodeoxyribonuclease V gamma subunit